ncbi:MAG TPA: DUF72 domain-containing protein [Nitrospira sp.]|nr:DUF72 domain-containing protein [Nitrospira sp.]
MPLSPLIRFGTSTWTYEGWQGQAYLKQYAKTTFARECLGEYCQYLYNGEPCFRTVGNDATFYRPPTPNQLRKYLNQIHEDFEMYFKVWEEITIPSYAKHARYGTKAGQPNPNFPNAKIFHELVLAPYRDAKFELVIPRSLLRGSSSLVPSGTWLTRETRRSEKGHTVHGKSITTLCFR